MKKILVSCLMLAAIVACNNEEKGSDAATEKKEEKPAEKPAESAMNDNPDYQKGLELIAKSNCFTCHKVDEAYTGPTYRQVADKYASQAPAIIPQLADKIIKGGVGVWGQVPMIPHPEISQPDAEAMVKYILLLKK